MGWLNAYSACGRDGYVFDEGLWKARRSPLSSSWDPVVFKLASADQYTILPSGEFLRPIEMQMTQLAAMAGNPGGAWTAATLQSEVGQVECKVTAAERLSRVCTASSTTTVEALPCTWRNIEYLLTQTGRGLLPAAADEAGIAAVKRPGARPARSRRATARGALPD